MSYRNEDHPPIKFYDSIECADTSGLIRGLLAGKIDSAKTPFSEILGMASATSTTEQEQATSLCPPAKKAR